MNKSYIAVLLGMLMCGVSLPVSAATKSFSVTQNVGTAPTTFNLGKFDSGLGTLTAVDVTIDFSTLYGSVSVRNNDATAVNVAQFRYFFDLSESATLGIDLYTGLRGVVTTTPAWQTSSIAAGGTQVFTIAANQKVVNNVAQSILSSYFSAYESVGGVGTVSIDATTSPSITTSGSSYTVDSSSSGGNTKMSVTYTYDAVPEPSTFLLFGLAGALVVGARRRRAA